MTSRRPQPPVEGSWRMVDGENDSFDTTVLPSVGDEDLDDLDVPLSSEQPSSGFPSQLSALSQQGTHMSLGSQDSIRDFSRHQDDDHVILREPFRPSMPGSRASHHSHRSPDPEFRMPILDVGFVSAEASGRRTQGGGAGKASGARDERGVARQRRQGGGAGNRQSAKDSPSKRRRSGARKEDEDEDEDGRSVNNRILNFLPTALLDILSWLLGVVGLSFRYAQKPLALLLAIYLSFGAIIVAQDMVTRSLSASLSPLCLIPGVSLLNLPFCPPSSSSPLSVTDESGRRVEFDELMNVQAKFERVLEKSAEGVSLPFEMKRSEATIRDLRTLVRNSDIQAREELVLEFDGYVDAARQSASDLQRFNTHCGAAVDTILAINRFTARYIDSLDPASGESLDGQSGLLSRWTAWFFYPFTPASGSRAAFSERIILDKYIEHTARVSDRIDSLILEAQAVLRLLARAEDHLGLIHEISSQSSTAAAAHRNQIFWTLWTLVGANNARLHNLSQQLSLLRQVDSQRGAAIAQVSDLIVELEGIQASLGDLRDRVAEPELLRESDTHSRTGPIPLSVHIETINGGVERLETARRRIRAAEDDRVRDALKRGGVTDEQLIESQ